jgi:hypothetical protein
MTSDQFNELTGRYSFSPEGSRFIPNVLQIESYTTYWDKNLIDVNLTCDDLPDELIGKWVTLEVVKHSKPIEEGWQAMIVYADEREFIADKAYLIKYVAKFELDTEMEKNDTSNTESSSD